MNSRFSPCDVGSLFEKVAGALLAFLSLPHRISALEFTPLDLPSTGRSVLWKLQIRRFAPTGIGCVILGKALSHRSL
jgi:hypothetical protein